MEGLMDKSTLENIIRSLKEIYTDVKHDLTRSQMTEFEKVQDNLHQFLITSDKKKSGLDIKRLIEGISGVTDFQKDNNDGEGFWVTFRFYGNTHRIRFWANGCPILETCEPYDKRIVWKMGMVFQMFCPQVAIEK
jgi:hypothetical protein